MNYLKYFLWWLGIWKDCPQCHSRLLEVDTHGWRLYKCSNSECDFGKRRLHYSVEIWKR